jgi:dTDP-4-dehydrorhamnose 3,5-epimerase
VALWVPAGFAHGFYVTSERATVLYKCTDFYAPPHERTIRWDDPDLAIGWPVAGGAPTVSAKDAAGKLFQEAETFA